MDRESQPELATLITQLKDKLPLINFYRFCQLLESIQPEQPGLGSTVHPHDDPIRFRPHPGMGFPVSELKAIETEPGDKPSIRTTFLGLYGVESPLPPSYVDDIAQQREGHEAVMDFLDLFNHRLTTQFYRIWRKYSYPATFKAGGKDETSQYLLGLIGLGIPGCAAHIGTPTSRFLALLGTMRLPTRTAEGICALIKLLAPHTAVTVTRHDQRRIPLDNPVKMSCRSPVSLAHKPVLGKSGIDVNSQVLLTLTTTDPEEVRQWLPPEGQLHADLMALLHAYLGSRVHARLQLRIPRELLPDARLSVISGQGMKLGQTAVMRRLSSVEVKNVMTDNKMVDKKMAGKKLTDNKMNRITIGLGRYQAAPEQVYRKETDEYGNYRF
ncbi:type VI secretion system baseplate subunit TssG [Xenorhabdus sp. 42]|uniref:type VI secretion system baseplate subunit TssG n=1 Tax=Xenorhabdus szentirmaii TaxID=290112 RepID=UPI0019BD52AE|nr:MULTISPECIES: type VI secretion system baseplate subunit TssG [unclassified Xenorhabdus]MBD2792980.1 type VI secretion system baseplate subunit TssG [Xenorhabdus sp. CUL]MBD2806732.1 type VI secretion system baseplate subunit TssG [Xenorhabdus sp. ZM]MBD2822406.1 type VI secretion system baseplate subunit TssG [Xenorhabdus sp. 42]